MFIAVVVSHVVTRSASSVWFSRFATTISIRVTVITPLSVARRVYTICEADYVISKYWLGLNKKLLWDCHFLRAIILLLLGRPNTSHIYFELQWILDNNMLLPLSSLITVTSTVKLKMPVHGNNSLSKTQEVPTKALTISKSTLLPFEPPCRTQ